jgi:hypothetical protein
VDGARQVARRVEQRIFVRFDEPDAGVVEVLGNPVGADENFGVSVSARLNI